MNIIEHLTRTVTPIVLGNNAADTNRVSLLERAYAIIVARLADNDVYNGFANTTITNEDHGFFDRLLPETAHRGNMIRELSSQFNVPEQETQSLISRAAPLVYNELRNLAGTTPLSTFLSSHLSNIGTSLPTWSYALIPAGVLGAMKINDTNRVNTATPVTQTVTRTEEHLVATPKKEEGGLMKMLLPLIGLLILGALAWALLKSCNKPEPVTTTTVVSSTTSSTTQVTPVAVDPATVSASANEATVTASSVTINDQSASATTGMTDTAMAPVGADTAVGTAPATTVQTISDTEPSVYLENGRLSFYFVTAKSDVAPQAKDKLLESKLLDAVQQGKQIGVSGYTDSTGNAAFNEQLSKDRAQAIKQFLVANGVPENQIDLIKPQDTVGAEGKTQEGRRVDVYLVDGPAVVSTTTTVVASLAQ